MRELIGNAHCVLFDFDGPICSLFASRSPESIARRLRELAAELDASALLTPALAVSADPHEVLRGIEEQQPDPDLVRRLEEALTREETAAAESARPTPHAGELLAALTAQGRKIAVVTNNSPRAVERYLRLHDLVRHVNGRVHGRTRDMALLKPHPDPLLRALRSTGTPASRALMIGDTPVDLSAARSAGVPFIGYARDTAGESALREAGARHVTRSLQRILTLTASPTFD
ncbi:HAD family hydrolase [Streptomyces sodiiphilus]|uniref:HAD family hydrolase n=1 Tax=Streptomyces sodiiphilus TaxID=226217 RepID=A0ABP5B615_9ACTN